MKVFLIWFALGFFPIEKRVDRFPASGTAYSGCDSKETSVGILVGKRVPETVLYHYGKKEILFKDVAEGTIPLQDWNKYIMGDQTRFKLKRYRRGFYGTEQVEDADRFGDSTYNWMVKIELEPKCLVPEKVISLVYLPRNPIFQKWYETKKFPKTFEAWKTECFDSLDYPRHEQFKDYSNPTERADEPENGCEKAVADFYEDRGFAFVQDHAGDLVRSWAIRNRDCIRKIHGSSEFWVREFAEKKEIWSNSCDRDRNHRNNIRIWFKAISEAGIDASSALRFRRMMEKVAPPLDVTDWQTEEADRFAAQDFASTLEEAVRRCETLGQAGKVKFRNNLIEISEKVDELQSSEVHEKLGVLCR